MEVATLIRVHWLGHRGEDQFISTSDVHFSQWIGFIGTISAGKPHIFMGKPMLSRRFIWHFFFYRKAPYFMGKSMVSGYDLHFPLNQPIDSQNLTGMTRV